MYTVLLADRKPPEVVFALRKEKLFYSVSADKTQDRLESIS